MATEAQIRKIVREEAERGSNRTIKFMTAVVNQSGRSSTDELAKWTKAMADYTIGELKRGSRRADPTVALAEQPAGLADPVAAP